jgi:hypothetical protein
MIRVLMIFMLIFGCCRGDLIVRGTHLVSQEWLRANAASFSLWESQLSATLTGEGYLEANVNVAVADADTLVNIEPGKLYHISDVKATGVDEDILSNAVDVVGSDQPLSSGELERLSNEIVGIYADRGYPFAKLEIRQMYLDNGKLKLDYLLVPGPKGVIGSIQYSGLRTTLPRALNSRIKLVPGEVYSESNLDRSASALSRLDFCHLTGTPAVLYNSHSEKVDIRFPMADSRNLSVDGALVLLPDNTLSGNAELRLLNLLGGGRRLDLSWFKKDPHSQQLEFDLLLPYFSGRPFDLRLNLSQEDRDSSFISTRAQGGIEYHLGADWSIGGQAGWAKITPEESRSTPSARELSVILSSYYDHRDDPFRTLNGAQLSYHFRSTYRREFGSEESIVSGYSTSLDGDLRLWRRLAGALALYSRLRAFQIRSDFEPIPIDQLIPVGGTATVRGYREYSYLANIGAISTVELHWYAVDRLLLRVFTDNAYIGTANDDFGLTGFGAGLSVETTLGVVRFDVSMGEEKSLSKLLVHFGFEGDL